MSQHLEQTHERPLAAEVPIPTSTPLETLEITGSVSANPDRRLPHVDLVETIGPDQHNHDADTKLTADAPLTSVDSDPGKEEADGVNASQDSSGNSKDAEGDDLGEAGSDFMSSYWKLQYDHTFDQTFEQRKKKAVPWLKHSLCNDMLVHERIDIIEKVLTTKGFLAVEASTEDTNEKKILRSESLSPIKLGWFAFTSCDIENFEATCFAVLLVANSIQPRTLSRSSKRAQSDERLEDTGRECQSGADMVPHPRGYTCT
jgi:hypothetical protein